MLRTRMIQTTSLLAGLLLAASSFAQVPADAPAGTTGLCKDGTYTSSATRKGSCRGHKGVQTWYAAAPSDTGAAPDAAPAPKTMNAPATTPAPSAPAATMTPPTTAPAAASPSPTTTMTAPATAPKAGGGPGLVWVNTSTKVYHCPADPWYGKTKAGAYMSEADAKAQGAHADHGKPCS